MLNAAEVNDAPTKADSGCRLPCEGGQLDRLGWTRIMTHLMMSMTILGWSEEDDRMRWVRPGRRLHRKTTRNRMWSTTLHK